MSDVKRYRVPEKWMIDGLKDGSFDASHNLKVVVLHSDYEQKVSDLLARITSLEREKEEARAARSALVAIEREATLCANHGIKLQFIQFVLSECYEVRAMKGTKP